MWKVLEKEQSTNLVLTFEIDIFFGMAVNAFWNTALHLVSHYQNAMHMQCVHFFNRYIDRSKSNANAYCNSHANAYVLMETLNLNNTDLIQNANANACTQ